MSKYVTLNFDDHSKIRVSTERNREMGDNVMFVPVFPHEFTRVQANFPIVLLKEQNSGRFRPISLFGFENEENLFLDEEQWPKRYLPLAVRMKPFIIGRKSKTDLVVQIDIEHNSVGSSKGEALFTEQGEETTYLKNVIQILSEINEAEQSLPTFCAMLDELGLIEPLILEITLNSGETKRLVGYYTVSDERLGQMNESNLGRLRDTNCLLPIFMMIASLAQIDKMVDWKLSKEVRS